MNTDQLRAWLGLPPGPWPPDDRTLLGFGPDPLSPADVEARALEKMELLRPHQLTQPELVTEGMNRLAQAMIGLSESTAAPPPPAPKPKRAKRLQPPSGSKMDLRRDTTDPGGMFAEVVEAEPILEAEVLDPEVISVSKPRRPKVFRPPDQLPPEPLKLDEVPPSNQEPPAPPAGLRIVPAERRKGYAKLVRLRRLRRGFEALKGFYADPGERLLTPVRLFGFIDALKTFYECDSDAAWPVKHGRFVRRLASDPLPISVFRSLVASQRKAVATDWAKARAELDGEYRLARETLRQSRPRPGSVGRFRDVRVWFAENPEWLAVVLFVAAFAVAVVRGMKR